MGGAPEGLWRDVLIAKRINAASGGAVIAPWEVGQLPEAWVNALLNAPALAATVAEANERLETKKAEIRARHR